MRLLDILTFTLYQGILSTALSVSLAFVLARAFAYHTRSVFFEIILSLPLLTPAIVGILGYTLLFKAGGIFEGVLPRYGSGAIIAAHVIFYTPYLVVCLWQGYRSIPFEHYRIADQLGLGSWMRFQSVEFPTLKPYLINVSWLCLTLSITSFTTVFVLGGGPGSTTLSIALFQFLFQNFHLNDALLLAVLQMGGCLLFFALNVFVPKPIPQVSKRQAPLKPSFLSGAGVILASGLCLIPLGIVLAKTSFTFSPVMVSATLKSLQIGICSGSLTLLLAWWILSQNNKYYLYGGLGIFFIPTSFLGFMIMMIQVYGGELYPFPSIILINTLLTLPYVLNTLKDPYAQAQVSYGRLIESIGISRPRMMLSLLKAPLWKAYGVSAALAAGDLSALLMFSDTENPGLSSLIYHQLGGYQMGEAMTTAALLMTISFMFVGLGALMGRRTLHVNV